MIPSNRRDVGRQFLDEIEKTIVSSILITATTLSKVSPPHRTCSEYHTIPFPQTAMRGVSSPAADNSRARNEVRIMHLPSITIFHVFTALATRTPLMTFSAQRISHRRSIVFTGWRSSAFNPLVVSVVCGTAEVSPKTDRPSVSFVRAKGAQSLLP